MKKKTKNHWDVKDVLFEWEKAAAGALQHQHLLKNNNSRWFLSTLFFANVRGSWFLCGGGEVNRRQKSFFFILFFLLCLVGCVVAVFSFSFETSQNQRRDSDGHIFSYRRPLKRWRFLTLGTTLSFIFLFLCFLWERWGHRVFKHPGRDRWKFGSPGRLRCAYQRNKLKVVVYLNVFILRRHDRHFKKQKEKSLFLFANIVNIVQTSLCVCVCVVKWKNRGALETNNSTAR